MTEIVEEVIQPAPPQDYDLDLFRVLCKINPSFGSVSTGSAPFRVESVWEAIAQIKYRSKETAFEVVKAVASFCGFKVKAPSGDADKAVKTCNTESCRFRLTIRRQRIDNTWIVRHPTKQHHRTCPAAPELVQVSAGAVSEKLASLNSAMRDRIRDMLVLSDCRPSEIWRVLQRDDCRITYAHVANVVRRLSSNPIVMAARTASLVSEPCVLSSAAAKKRSANDSGLSGKINRVTDNNA